MKRTTIVLCLCLAAAAPVRADPLSDNMTPEARLRALETRVDELTDAFYQVHELLNNLYASVIQSGAAGESAPAADQVAEIDAKNGRMSKVLTSSGFLYFSVRNVEKTDKGCVLNLKIGNPNLTYLEKVALKLRWGRGPEASAKRLRTDDWRSSLTSAEYPYSGALEPGVWTEIPISLSPVDTCPPNYIDGEIMVQSVSLQKPLGR